MSNKVHYKGKFYKSIVEFYDSNKDEIEVSYQNVLKNFKDGLPPEEAIKKQPRKVESKQSTHGPFKIEGKRISKFKVNCKRV